MSEPDAFHQLTTMIDYPMAVVTAAAGGVRSGCLVGFHTQCSIVPVRYVVFVSRANHTAPVAAASRHLAVHLLDESEFALAELFGERTGDEVDKFAGLEVRDGPGGVPLLDTRAWFVGAVVDRVDDGGDHLGFVLAPDPDPAGGHVDGRLRQLGFQRTRDLRPGHPAS